MSNLPARFSEAYFRKYEPHIKTIIDVWPKPVDFNVSGSVTTFACRLRDAMRSLCEHKWETSINMEVFNQIYRSHKDKDFVVQEQANGVVRVIDNKLLINTESEQVSAKTTTDSHHNPPVELTNLCDTEIAFLCRLAHLRLLTCPIILELTDEHAQTLLSTYDILLEIHSGGKYLLT